MDSGHMDYQMDIAPNYRQSRCPYMMNLASDTAATQSNSPSSHLDPTIPAFQPLPTPSSRTEWPLPHQYLQRDNSRTSPRPVPLQQRPASPMPAPPTAFAESDYLNRRLDRARGRTIELDRQPPGVQELEQQFARTREILARSHGYQPDAYRSATTTTISGPGRFQGLHTAGESQGQTDSPASPAVNDATQRRNLYTHTGRSHGSMASRIPTRPPTLSTQPTFFPNHLPRPSNFERSNTPYPPGYSSSQRHAQPPPQPAEPPVVAQPGPDPSNHGERLRSYDIQSLVALQRTGRERMSPEEAQQYLRMYNASQAVSQAYERADSVEAEERENRLEREQAVQRAMNAAAKPVASSKLFASLEKPDLSSLSEEARSCIICYNKFGIRNPDGKVECAVRLPKCKHVFGDHCLKEWLKDTNTCPYCRDKLPSSPKKIVKRDNPNAPIRTTAQRFRRNIDSNGHTVAYIEMEVQRANFLQRQLELQQTENQRREDQQQERQRRESGRGMNRPIENQISAESSQAGISQLRAQLDTLRETYRQGSAGHLELTQLENDLEQEYVDRMFAYNALTNSSHSTSDSSMRLHRIQQREDSMLASSQANRHGQHINPPNPNSDNPYQSQHSSSDESELSNRSPPTILQLPLPYLQPPIVSTPSQHYPHASEPHPPREAPENEWELPDVIPDDAHAPPYLDGTGFSDDDFANLQEAHTIDASDQELNPIAWNPYARPDDDLNMSLGGFARSDNEHALGVGGFATASGYGYGAEW